MRRFDEQRFAEDAPPNKTREIAAIRQAGLGIPPNPVQYGIYTQMVDTLE